MPSNEGLLSVDPRELKRNPIRNFRLHPLDDETVEIVRKSIEEHGYWGGVVCRRNKHGKLEIACGHVRVRAAILAGLKKIDVLVRSISDLHMLLVQAREDALQRNGNKFLWLYSTVHGLTKMLMQAMEDDEPGELFPDQRTLEKT
jgi:ParB/RepB/Spo0J family partition protein